MEKNEKNSNTAEKDFENSNEGWTFFKIRLKTVKMVQKI